MQVEFADKQKWRGLPSMALPAICFMDQFLTKDMKVFEWGSGGSTIFFHKRAEVVATFEHDNEWACTTLDALCYWGIKKHVTHFYLVPPKNTPTAKYGSAWPGWAGWSFEEYVRKIEEFPDNHFDLVSVDGRARQACLLAAMPKVRPGGLLVLDDAQRDRYQMAMAQIDWPYQDFAGDIPYQQPGLKVQTRVWLKEGAEEKQCQK